MDEYLDFAKDLAYEAGKIMQRYFQADDIGTTWKEDDTPLTVADSMINRLVIKSVQQKFPDHGVLGEEESFNPSCSLIWVVDPIDGTVPFSLGIPTSTFSIALVDRENGQPKVAVVFDPFLDHMYSALPGQGTALNGRLMHTSKTKELNKSYIFIAGGFKNGQRKFLPGELYDRAKGMGAKPISIPSYIYFACKVATGELVGAIVGLSTSWDLASVSLIIKEAGGTVTDLNGNQQRYDAPTNGHIVAANQEIHNQLLKMVKGNNDG